MRNFSICESQGGGFFHVMNLRIPDICTLIVALQNMIENEHDDIMVGADCNMYRSLHNRLAPLVETKPPIPLYDLFELCGDCEGKGNIDTVHCEKCDGMGIKE